MRCRGQHLTVSHRFFWQQQHPSSQQQQETVTNVRVNLSKLCTAQSFHHCQLIVVTTSLVIHRSPVFSSTSSPVPRILPTISLDCWYTLLNHGTDFADFCVVNIVTLALFLLSSFFLVFFSFCLFSLHFPTQTCVRFSSVERSAIALKF